MKFTLGWLKDYLETDASLTAITERLTEIGLELEGLEDPAEKFAAFKVAYVEKAEKHPDADRLKVCIVDTGAEKLQVVCGAPNAREGMKGIFAPAGSFVPGTGMELRKGMIRGQESNGMLVSEREMGLSEEHDGIIDVTDKDPEIGTPFAALYGLDDPVIEIGLTPNRADCAGVRGIARDLAAAGLGTLKPLPEDKVKGSGASPVNVTIADDTKDACPLFIGRMIKGVKNGPSPDWLQQRLKAIGLRPISALVDITNYFCIGLCRPLHVFDADKLKGDITVRFAKDGETLAALDEKEYTLTDGMTAVCDESGVVGLAGVIGGAETGCTEDTVNVYLECAYFDPARTAKTGRALGIISDARYRFERGIDPAFTPQAAELATQMILDLCGGEASDSAQAGNVPDWQREIPFDPAYTEKLTGLAIPAKEQTEILEKLGFDAKGDKALPPSWRGDVEGRADLVEEVARIYGYDKIEPVSMRAAGAVTISGETEAVATSRKARAALAARGLQEAITWSFMGEERARAFGSNDNKALKLLNPISSELAQMRPSILPNLIEAAGRNHDKGMADCALFEVGPAFRSGKPDGYDIVAAGVRQGRQGPRHWSSNETNRNVDAFDAKADALAALEACGAPTANLQATRDAPDYFHPGRSGALRLGPNVLAYFGEIHPAILQDMDVKAPVVAFEIFLGHIPAQKKKGTAKKLLEVSPLQPVQRDFAFIVDQDVEADALMRAAKGADKNLVSAVDVFDVYSGEHVGEGKKSIAINVKLQPTDKTLTEEDLNDFSTKVVDNVVKKTGGALRN